MMESPNNSCPASLADLILKANELGHEMADILDSDLIETPPQAIMLVNVLQMGMLRKKVVKIQVQKDEYGLSHVMFATEEAEEE